MKHSKQVRIVQIPTKMAPEWRAQIAEACAQAGWTYAESWSGEPHESFNDNSVVVGWFMRTDDSRATWIIHAAPPSDVLALLLEQGLGEAEAVNQAGLRLAIAAAGAESAALVASQADAHLDVPGLGRVVAPAEMRAALNDGAAAALSLYDELPIVPGKRVVWGANAFSYERETDGETYRINLLGRRRLLLNGPHIALPPGLWVVTARLNIEPLDMADLLIEWGYADDVVSLRHEFTRRGRYELNFSRRWTRAEPADFRISIMTSALAGVLELEELILKRVKDI